MNILALLLALSYPPAPRGDAADTPYQWMEDLDSAQVKQWVEAENKVTFSYLERLPQREPIKKRLTELWDYARTDVPRREAGHLFYRRNSGLQKQSVLYQDDGKTVIDPNERWPDGNTAMAEWKVSPDGRWLVYSSAAGGSSSSGRARPRITSGATSATTAAGCSSSRRAAPASTGSSSPI